MRVRLRKFFIAMAATMTATSAGTAPVVDPGTLLMTSGTPYGFTNIIAVSAKSNVLMLHVDGRLTAPGEMNGISNVALIAAGYGHDVALMQDGTVLQWPATNQPPVPSNLTNVVALAAGYRFTCALQQDGRVAVWGRFTQATNIPPGLTNVVAIAAGRDHILALTDTGNVVAWGSGSARETNVPPAATNIAFIAAVGLSSAAITSNGFVWRWGEGLNFPYSINVARRVRQVAATRNRTYLLDTNDNLVLAGSSSIPWNVTNLAGIFGSDSNLYAIARGPVLRPDRYTPPQYPVPLQSGGYGQNWAFAATAESYYPFTYQWFFNRAPLPGANGPFLRLMGLNSTNSGTYYVMVTNAYGTMTSAPVTLNISINCDEAASLATETANNTTPASFGLPPVLPPGFVYSTIPSGVGSAVTSMAFAPDGRIFVCEQRGSIRIANPLGPSFPSPFATVTRTDYGGEIGLLGIAFDPGFHTNSFLYVYYTVPEPDLHNRISRLTAEGNVAKSCSERILLEIESPRKSVTHQGGALQFGPDGKLYAGVGDHTLPSEAQSLSSLAGKILRINPDGTLPEDNPFYNVASGPNRAIWAIGLRNPFTFAIDPRTGRMLINDVGGKWEEVNAGVPGANYGWPIEHGDFETNIYTNPVHSYLTWPTSGFVCDAAIIGAAFYDPPRRLLPPEYVGSYFFGDYCRGWIRRLDTNGIVHNFASNVVGLVDIDVGPDGALYCLLNSGVIFRFAAAPSRFVSAEQLTDGRVHLRVTGVPNQPYVLEQSTDLENWQPLSTNQSATNPFDVYDPAPPNTSQRFYRLRD